MAEGESTPSTQATATCIHCGYDLRGSPLLKCPECGNVHTPGARRRLTPRDWIITAAMTIAATYLPWAWMLVANPSSGRPAPGLLQLAAAPGWLAGALLGAEHPAAGAALTAGALALAIWLGVRGWWQRISITVLLGAGSGLSAAVAHGLSSIRC